LLYTQFGRGPFIEIRLNRNNDFGNKVGSLYNVAPLDRIEWMHEMKWREKGRTGGFDMKENSFYKVSTRDLHS